MKAFWTGSDALFLVMYPPSYKRKYLYIFLFRLYARLTDFFVQSHLINHEGLRTALLEFGMGKPIYVLEDKYDETIYPKVKHEGFNVLFYLPKKANKPYGYWIYGKEYLDWLKTAYNVFVVNGSADMGKVLPYIDAYVKINRTKYNALNRLGKECVLNKIPVIEVNCHKYSFEQNVKWLGRGLDNLIEERL